MLIGVIGKKGAGKTSFAEHLEFNHGYVLEAFANPLKEGMKDFFGFTNEQVYGNEKEVVDPFWGITPRLALQIAGTELFQFEMPKYVHMITGKQILGRDFWIRCMERRLKTLGKDVVISDMRFKGEAQFVLDQGGTIVRIINKSLPPSKDTHSSETELDNIDVPIIYNDGVNMDSFRLSINKYMHSLQN